MYDSKTDGKERWGGEVFKEIGGGAQELAEGVSGFSEETLRKFWNKVDKRASNDCWIWTPCRRPGVYGHLRIMPDGSLLGAHCVSWIIHFGRIPNRLHVCHKCDNPPCVNPNHLWLGTHVDNMHDRDMKGRGKVNLIAQSGEANHRARFKNRDILKIREYAFRGMKQVEISALLGIEKSYVSKIVLRKIWKTI